MRHPTVVILSAGMGSRLGRPHPKAMTPLGAGQTIFSRQLGIFRRFQLPVIVVVGFKKDLIMEADTRVLFAYNADFDTTNTSKSLLCALENIYDKDVLWINGDVVFDGSVIQRMLQADGSLVAVNEAPVGREEVKYSLDVQGRLDAISKNVPHPLGEALGINYLEAAHLETFKQMLRAVGDGDYFEKAMEHLITTYAPVFRPFRVSGEACIEVDFEVDLKQARKMAARWDRQDREK